MLLVNKVHFNYVVGLAWGGRCRGGVERKSSSSTGTSRLYGGIPVCSINGGVGQGILISCREWASRHDDTLSSFCVSIGAAITS